MGIPRVSIALPVHNGENYLDAAIRAFQAQTFEDFELVLSDNASTDRTAQIGRDWAATDARVRYYRSTVNRGASWNFNRAYELSVGTYVKWAAHDDLCAPAFLERCVDVLERRPAVVLCHTECRVIGPQGEAVEDYGVHLRTDAAWPRHRFYDLLFVKNRCYEIFGLIRRSVLRQTRLMGSYPVADRVLLAELALRGPFHQVPERLFHPRLHPSQSTQALITQHQRVAWFDTRRAARIVFPEWRALAEYSYAVAHAPIGPTDRLVCALYMLNWARCYRKRMRHDLRVAVRQALAALLHKRPLQQVQTT
ncbi:MAG: glycosyltransferase family 2 protein [Candidatus Latescibacterota bacterium]